MMGHYDSAREYDELAKLKPLTKNKVDDLFADDIINKTADKIIESGNLMQLKDDNGHYLNSFFKPENLQQKFESFCKEYNLDYDFESKGGYYRNWQTNQAFVIYKFSDMEKRK